MKEIIDQRRQEAVAKLNDARRLAGAAAKAYMDDPCYITLMRRTNCRKDVREAQAQLEEWTAETEGKI